MPLTMAQLLDALEDVAYFLRNEVVDAERRPAWNACLDDLNNAELRLRDLSGLGRTAVSDPRRGGGPIQCPPPPSN